MPRSAASYLGAFLVGWCDGAKGPTALAVGAGGVVWTFLSRLSFLCSFSLSLGDGRVETELLSQRAVKPENNQPGPEVIKLFSCSTQLSMTF